MFLIVFSIIVSCFILRVLSQTCILQIAKKWSRELGEKFYLYQFYRVPEFNKNMQQNQLYKIVKTYLNSIPGVEDSDFTALISGSRANEINVVLDSDQIVADEFLSSRVYWINNEDEKSLVLKIRRNDKRRIIRPYLKHIHSIVHEIEQRRKDLRVYMNMEKKNRWISVPFSHPATIDTVVMDPDLKNRVKSDLELFLKSKHHYHRLGKLWRRSYLLHGGSGTGKSTFAAAMAKFLRYDVYDLDLAKISGDSDLKTLLLKTTSKSLILIEDLDKSTDFTISDILNAVAGIFSCSGEERVLVFTISGEDPAILRHREIDFRVHFPLCDFNLFKIFANSHLGLKDHKLFHQVEDGFQTGSSLSPAEISGIMISNRSSPSRALKTVITALQRNGNRFRDNEPVRTGYEPVDSGIFCNEGLKEIRKLYGFLRYKSSRKQSCELDDSKENSSHHC